MDTNEKITDALDMATVPQVMDDDIPVIVSETGQVSSVPDNPVNKLLESDFDKARANIVAAIDAGQITLQDMMSWASQAQNDKAYAALASFFANYIKANEALLNIHKVKKEVTPPVTIQANNVLVATTADILRIINQNKEKQIKNA